MGEFTVENVWVKNILRGVTLNVEGGVTSIVGPNGSGKTTLLRVMAGLVKPDKGSVKRPRKIGSSWQNPYFSFTKPTVLEELSETVGGERGALEMLRSMDLENIAGKSPFTLSMGQARLISIILAVAWKPEAVILDEPTNGLSCEWKARVWGLLRSMKTTIVIASHDVEFALAISDRIVVLNEGTIVGEGGPKDVIKDLRTLGLQEPEAW